MEFLILLLIVSLLPFAKAEKTKSWNPDIFTWSNFTEHQIKELYVPYDSCYINGGTLDECRKLRQAPNIRMCESATGFEKIPQSFLRYPSNFPETLSYVDYFIQLNKSDTSFVMFGDSMTRESLVGLYCGILQESPRATVTPTIRKIVYGGARYVMTVPLADGGVVSLVFYLLAFYKHYIPGMMDSFVGDFFHTNAHEFSNVATVMNFGLHEQRFYGHFLDFTLEKIDQFATELKEKGVKFSLFFRETNVQHYNTTNGVFPHKLYWPYHRGKIPPPICSRPNSTATDSDISDFRYTSEVHGIQNNSNLLANGQRHMEINVVHFRELSKYYFDVHPASQFSIVDKSNTNWHHFLLDCTHYKGYIPVLYKALWGQVFSKLVGV